MPGAVSKTDLGLENTLKNQMNFSEHSITGLDLHLWAPGRNRAVETWLADVTFASLVCWPDVAMSVVNGDTHRRSLTFSDIHVHIEELRRPLPFLFLNSCKKDALERVFAFAILGHLLRQLVSCIRDGVFLEGCTDCLSHVDAGEFLYLHGTQCYLFCRTPLLCQGRGT